MTWLNWLYYSLCGLMISYGVFSFLLKAWVFSWKKIDADIISIEILKVNNPINRLDNFWMLTMRYSYNFSGDKIESDRLNISNKLIYKEKKLIEELVEKKINKNKVSIYVCPLFPYYSVVFPGLSKKIVNIFFIFLGATMVFIAHSFS